MSYTLNQEKMIISNNGKVANASTSDTAANANNETFSITDQGSDLPSLVLTAGELGSATTRLTAHGLYQRTEIASTGAIHFFPNGANIALGSANIFFTNTSPYAFKAAGTTWTVSSDANIKKNIRQITNALDKLTALNPVHYEYKTELPGIELPEGTKTGFIAQEFQEVLPGHVHEAEIKGELKNALGKDKMLLLEADLVPYLVKAIQELKAELDTVKAELATLKG